MIPDLIAPILTLAGIALWLRGNATRDLGTHVVGVVMILVGVADCAATLMERVVL